MNRKMLLRLAIAVQMMSALFLLPAYAADGCQPLHDSVMKRLSTSSHMYMTETAGYLKVGPRSSEMIYLNADIYIYVGGKWRKSPINKDDMIQQQKENWQNAKNTTCHVVRDESVNGVATTVYAVHSELTMINRMVRSGCRKLPVCR